PQTEFGNQDRSITLTTHHFLLRQILRRYSLGVTWLQLQRRGEVGAGLVALSHRVIRQAPVAVGRRKVGGPLDRPAKVGGGLGMLALGPVSVAAIAVGQRAAGIELDRLVEVLDCRGVLFLAMQGM